MIFNHFFVIQNPIEIWIVIIKVVRSYPVRKFNVIFNTTNFIDPSFMGTNQFQIFSDLNIAYNVIVSFSITNVRYDLAWVNFEN